MEHLYLENVTGSDQHAVGVKIWLEDAVFVSRTFFCQNIKKIKEGELERVFCSNRVYEIYHATNINEVLDILEFKIVRALNIVAHITKVTKKKHYAKWLMPVLLVKIRRRNKMRKKAIETKKKEEGGLSRLPKSPQQGTQNGQRRGLQS